MTNLESWFCLRSQPKHEHIAAAHLRKLDGVEVFLPRVRFQRPTRQGIAWVTEALFPNYLFARFDWHNLLRQVQAAHGVGTVVHFGDHWPLVPPGEIEELRRVMGAAEVHVITDELQPGDAVEIAEGALRGLRAVVLRAMPSRARVALLMDFLGQQTTIEVPRNSLLKDDDRRKKVFPLERS